MNMLSFSLCSTHLEILTLSNETLYVVSRATTLARLLYTAPPGRDSYKLQTDNAWNASLPEPAQWDIPSRL